MKFARNPLPYSRLAGAVLLAALAALPARADYQSTVLSQGPVGYWRLNETTQPLSYTVMATNSGSLGSSAIGTYNNYPIRGLTGPFAGSEAMSVDGVSQSVTTPWQGALNPSTFSVEVWVNPTQVPEFGYIATSVHTASPRSGWYLVQDNNGTFGLGNGFVVRMFNTNGSNPSITLFATNDLPSGSWYHLVLTYDGTTATLYKNGTVAQSGNPAVNGAGLGFVPNGDAQFSVGMRSDNGFWWSGQEAEVALYTGALSGTRVSAHYTTATTTPANYAATVQADSPTLYYRFQEPADPVAVNAGSLGSAGNGRYVYPARAGVAGPAPLTYPGFDAGNNSVAFSGPPASVTLKPLNLNTNTVTITCWVNLTNPQPQAAGIVFSRAGSTVAGITTDPIGYGGGYGLGYNWGGQGTSWSPYNDGGLPLLPDSDWAFVALVVQPSQAALFMCDRTNFGNFIGATNTVPHGVLAFSGATTIGMDPNTTPLGINGAVDEVSIFNRALSAGEVYDQYAEAVGGVPPRVFGNPQTPLDTIYAGDTLQLVVDAGGSPTLTYQWRKDGNTISGATTSVYVKNSTTTGDTGTYDCVLNNSFGTATSGGAYITITPAFPPSVIQGPIGRTLYPGGVLNLNVLATGGGLRYQWQRSGTNLPGATSSAYIVTNITAAVAGSYSVTITNSLGNIGAGPVSILVPTLTSGSYAAVVDADAPEAWWRLDEVAGSSTNGGLMFDAMGRHDGYYTNLGTGQIALGRPGAIIGGVAGTAATFPGTNSFGYVPFSTALNGAGFSLECWTRMPSAINFLNPVSSFGNHQGYALDTQSGVWYGYIGSGGVDYIFGYWPNPGNPLYNPTILPGQWMHLVITCQPTGTYPLQIYINGQSDGYIWSGFDHNPSFPFIVGGLGTGDGTVATRSFVGDIDEVAVYSRPLTAAQIQAHYYAAVSGVAPYFVTLPKSQEVLSNSAATVSFTGSAAGTLPMHYQWLKNGTPIAGATTTILTINLDYTNAAAFSLQASNTVAVTNCPAVALNILPPNPPFVNVTNGLVLHLKFDGNYQDSSGRGNNATAVGSPSIVAGRLGSGGLYFYTSNAIPSVNYLTLGKPADLNFSSNVNFSVAYWVKTEPGQTNGDLPFLCSANNSTFGPGLTFAPSYKEGGWAWSLNGVGVYGAAASINDGNWHHVLSTFDRAGFGQTYLDGALVDSTLIFGAGNVDTGNTFNIGQDPTGAYGEDGSATIDDMAVWRRALTAYEAYAIYYSATNSNASFDVPGRVKLSLQQVGGNLQISWRPGATLGTLLQADSITGPWTPVPVYVPSYTVTPTGAQKFYRLQTIE